MHDFFLYSVYLCVVVRHDVVHTRSYIKSSIVFRVRRIIFQFSFQLNTFLRKPFGVIVFKFVDYKLTYQPKAPFFCNRVTFCNVYD